MKELSLNPLIYEWTIEPLLNRIKQKVARLVFRYDLSPVLDLCCGTGKQGHFIDLGGNRVCGLDLSFRMLSYARKKYPAIPFICADAACLPCRSGVFKGIILSYALHEKPEKIRQKIIEECRRLLRPGGKIIFVDYDNPWDRLSRFGGVFTWLIERAARGDHYKNSRQFLAKGGLSSFIRDNGLFEVKSYDLNLGSSRLVVTQLSSDFL